MRARFEARVVLQDLRHLEMKNRHKKQNVFSNRLNANLIQFMDSLKLSTESEPVEIEEEEGGETRVMRRVSPRRTIAIESIHQTRLV